jgi:hypothetical protein
VLLQVLLYVLLHQQMTLLRFRHQGELLHTALRLISLRVILCFSSVSSYFAAIVVKDPNLSSCDPSMQIATVIILKCFHFQPFLQSCLFSTV